MEPHADAHGRFRRPSVCAERALRGDRAAHGVAGAHEREEECVALGVDLATTGAAELLAQDPAVLVQHIAIRIAEIATQLRRSFDVGEQERDRPRRQLTRGALDRTIVIADAAWFRALRTRRPSSGAAVVPAGGAASSPLRRRKVGSRAGGFEVVYAVDDAAAKYGACVLEETTNPDEAYSLFGPKERSAYQEGRLRS